jgi:hypothetical protein
VRGFFFAEPFSSPLIFTDIDTFSLVGIPASWLMLLDSKLLEHYDPMMLS